MNRFLALFGTAAAVATVGAAALIAPSFAQPYAPGYQSGYQGGYQYVPQRNYYQSRERERERDRDRDREREREREGNRYECKAYEGRITTAGGTRPTYGWALSSANSMWSRQARATFGEEWSDVRMAREERHRCFPVVLGKRCEVTAIPCREPSLR
jgi:hypothetical protein